MTHVHRVDSVDEVLTSVVRGVKLTRTVERWRCGAHRTVIITEASWEGGGGRNRGRK